MFPKIIHQIWLQGKQNMPDKYNEKIDLITSKHSDYKYIMWDEISILELINTNPNWVKTYYSFLYLHQKVDYARYVILYICGGIYIDVDVKVIKSFDEILEKNKQYESVFSYTSANMAYSVAQCSHSQCLNNGIIISKPKSEILEILINHIDNNPHCNKLTPKVMCILHTTGPAIFTAIISKYYENNKDKIKILAGEYLEPCIMGKCNITDNTIVIHEHDGTWVPAFQYNFIKNYIKYDSYICIVFIILVIIFVWKKYMR